MSPSDVSVNQLTRVQNVTRTCVASRFCLSSGLWQMKLQLINPSSPRCVFKPLKTIKRRFVCLGWKRCWRCHVGTHPAPAHKPILAPSPSLEKAGLDIESGASWERSEVSIRPETLDSSLIGQTRSLTQFCQGSGSGESPRADRPWGVRTEKWEIFSSSDVPLLKMPSVAVQLRPAPPNARRSVSSSALITPRRCQKQHDAAFHAAPHTVSEPAPNNSSPGPLIRSLGTAAQPENSFSSTLLKKRFDFVA